MVKVENVFNRTKNKSEYTNFHIGDIIQYSLSKDVVYAGVLLALKGQIRIAPQQITHAIVEGIIWFYQNQYRKLPVNHQEEWPIESITIADELYQNKYKELTKK